MYTSFRSIYKAPIRIKHDTIDDAEILTNVFVFTVLVKSHYKVKLVNILIRPALRNLINN